MLGPRAYGRVILFRLWSVLGITHRSFRWEEIFQVELSQYVLPYSHETWCERLHGGACLHSFEVESLQLCMKVREEKAETLIILDDKLQQLLSRTDLLI